MSMRAYEYIHSHSNHVQQKNIQDILTYFRGSELQNYFTRVLEDNLKAIIKPQVRRRRSNGQSRSCASQIHVCMCVHALIRDSRARARVCVKRAYVEDDTVSHEEHMATGTIAIGKEEDGTSLDTDALTRCDISVPT